MDKPPILSPEIQAKLRRLEELEESNAKLESSKKALEQRLIERGLQPDQHGIKTVMRTETHVVKRTVKRPAKELRLAKDEDGKERPVEVEVEKDVEVEVAEEREVEHYLFTIDLPPSGGISLTINGVPYFHGQEYEFTYHQLSDVRDMVHRSWAHERTIKGDDENTYRPQLSPRLNMRGNFSRR